MLIGIKKIVFGGFLMKGYRLYDELRNQYIFSKTFDKSDSMIGIFNNCEIRNVYGYSENKLICYECVCEYMCNKISKYDIIYQ